MRVTLQFECMRPGWYWGRNLRWVNCWWGEKIVRSVDARVIERTMCMKNCLYWKVRRHVRWVAWNFWKIGNRKDRELLLNIGRVRERERERERDREKERAIKKSKLTAHHGLKSLFYWEQKLTLWGCFFSVSSVFFLLICNTWFGFDLLFIISMNSWCHWKIISIICLWD